jgi:hypothetical protein
MMSKEGGKWGSSDALRVTNSSDALMLWVALEVVIPFGGIVKTSLTEFMHCN